MDLAFRLHQATEGHTVRENLLHQNLKIKYYSLTMERPEFPQITWVSIGTMASPMESVETGDSGSSFSKYCRYRAWENLD